MNTDDSKDQHPTPNSGDSAEDTPAREAEGTSEWAREFVEHNITFEETPMNELNEIADQLGMRPDHRSASEDPDKEEES